MSKNLQDQPTTTSQPTNFFVNLAGAVKQLTWAGAKALWDALYAPLSHAHDAGDITSGTLDPARIPLLYSGVQVVSSGAIADLDSDQQAAIGAGAVITTTDGRRWIYKGSGGKTSEGSYIETADVTPEWSVIANKPSTFAPSAHASSHKSGGADAIKLDELAAPTDVTTLDATTGAHGLMPKADKVKLDGIAASADVTSATNIASITHAATGKSTPVDADELGLIDSEASNVLKKLTWTNLKATLKTYYDTLYAALTHASRHKSGGVDAIKLDELAATTDVTTLNASTSKHGLLPKLGGGTTNFLRADGAWAAPGASGSVILRGRGILMGDTVPDHPESAPADLGITISDFSDFEFTLNGNQASLHIIGSSSDPSDPDACWIDTSSGDPATILGATTDAINTYAGSIFVGLAATNDGASVVNITDSNSGAAEYLGASGINITADGGGYGVDAADATGGVFEVGLISVQSGKITKPLRLWFFGDGAAAVGVEVCLKDGETYTPLTNSCAAYAGAGEWTIGGGEGEISEDKMDAWMNGGLNVSIIARFVDGTNPGLGGTVNVYAIAEAA